MSKSISDVMGPGGIYDADTGELILYGVGGVPQSLYEDALEQGWQFVESVPGGLVRVQRNTDVQLAGPDQFSDEVASIAGKVLNGGEYTHEEVMTLAGSALSRSG